MHSSKDDDPFMKTTLDEDYTPIVKKEKKEKNLEVQKKQEESININKQIEYLKKE